MTHSFSTLSIETTPEGVMTLTFDRPARANAVNGVMHDEILAFLRWLPDQREVGAVVLTGAGRSFCAGGDMELIEETRNADPWSTARAIGDVSKIVREFLDVPQPIVAAVNGAAVGLGATLALLSDIVIMADTATISDPHVRMGIVAGDGGTAVWPALVGPARAKEFLLTGDPVDAATAERIGLVNRVVPGDVVLAESRAFAARLAAGPRQAIAYTKRAINAAQARDAVPNVILSASYEAQTMKEPDVVEGMSSFRERRVPSWPSAAYVASSTSDS
jgi:enoyl-CoA hydratase